MNFLFPYWLITASAILIPVAIHLWNRRQGQTVKVGSLRWLEASASKRWSSLKLTDLWLLLLRCAIIIIISLALAAPFILRPPAASPAGKSVYLSEELLHSTSLESISATVDGLLQRGYRLFRYAPGFAPVTQESWQALSSISRDSLVSSGSHWQLLPALAQCYPQPQDSVWLFTSDQQRHFAGARPTSIPANITWISVAIEAPATWLQAAAKVGADSLLLVLGHSTREGTHYRHYRRAFNPSTQMVSLENGLQVQLQRQGNQLMAQLAGGPPDTMRVQTEPLVFSVFADEEQQAEVPYLRAVVRALSHYTGLPIVLKVDPAGADTAATMFFWLSREEIPSQMLQQVQRQGKRLWVQPGGEPASLPVSLAALGTQVSIRPASQCDPAGGFVRWETTAGEPLLTEEPAGRGRVYRFQSGFSAAWGQLGQSPWLPELLLPVLLPQPAGAGYDARALDEAQLVLAKQALAVTEPPEEQQFPLARWLVLAAFFLFLVERFIAGKRKTA